MAATSAMANLVGEALQTTLQGLAPHWQRASLQGCSGSPWQGGHERTTHGFGPGELTYTTEQLGQLLAAISERLKMAMDGKLLRNADTGSLVEDIRQATEALVWGEKHDDGLFDLFCERQTLAGFVAALLAPSVPQSVRVQLWQTLSILVQNARRSTSFYYLLSGGHLNTLLAGDPDLRNEETLAYFVAFMKSLSLRLDGETALLVLDRRPEAAWAGGFPLFAQTVRLATHRDHMICTAARAALLSLLRIDHPEVRSRAAEAACQLLVPSLARALRVSWAAESAAIRLHDAETLRVALESEDDLLGFLNDLLMLDVAGVTEALAQGVIGSALLPLFSTLAPPMSYPESSGGEAKEQAHPLERQQSVTSSHYDEVHFEQEQQQAPFLGTWFYGNSGLHFKISRNDSGDLVFEEVSPTGRQVQGTLYSHGHWMEGEISFVEGGGYGRIRLRFLQEKMAILSHFRGVNENRWGPDTLAYQFIGTWFYGKERTCFQISMTDTGLLKYKEQFPSGQRVSGQLKSSKEWLQADLRFSDGKACGTVRMRFVSKNGTMITNFRGQGEAQWGPDTTASKSTQGPHSLTATLGPAAAEIARTVSTMVLGLEPAQQGLVGAVIDRVLGSHSTGLGEPATDEGALQTLQSNPGLLAEGPPAEPPGPAVCVRAVASCVRSLSGHKSIMVPLAKVLLWPAVPSLIATAVYDPEGDAGQFASTSLAAAAGGLALTAPQVLPSVLVPNPFRAELLELLGGGEDGGSPREAPLVAWTLRELQEALPPFGLEDAGLLPPCGGHGGLSPWGTANSPRSLAEAGVAVDPWLRQWVPHDAQQSSSSGSRARAGSYGSYWAPPPPSAPPQPGREAPDAKLPERLVDALGVHAALPRQAQRVIAQCLLDLVRMPEAQVTRRRAKAATASALREAGDLLWLVACQDFDGNDGSCGPGFTEVVSGFLEEWEWQRDNDTRMDLLSTNASVQCLLQTSHAAESNCRAVHSPSSRSLGMGPARQAIRAFLTLQRLSSDLAALEKRVLSGQDPMTKAKEPKEPCPLGIDTDQDARTWAGQYPSVPCVGPWGGVYAQGHSLVLHPTQVLVTEPARLEGGAGVHVCVPVWRAMSMDSRPDPRILLLRVVAPLVGDGPAANRGGVEEVELRFQDSEAVARAQQHFRGAKAGECRRILSQLRSFIDRAVSQAAADPSPAAASLAAWAARWM